MYEIHQTPVSSILSSSTVWPCSLCRLLHPNSFVPSSPNSPKSVSSGLFCFSSHASFSSFCRSAPYGTFPVLLPFHFTSASPVCPSPRVLPPLVFERNSWLQSYLQPPCSHISRDRRTLKTRICSTAVSSSLLPRGSLRVMYLSGFASLFLELADCLHKRLNLIAVEQLTQHHARRRVDATGQERAE